MAAVTVLATSACRAQVALTPAPAANSTTAPAANRTTQDTAPPAPLLGVLQSDAHYRAQELAAGVQVVTLGTSWATAEPSPGVFNSSYLATVRDQIDNANAAGLRVVLDPGIQYPPDWVFDLPGGTRFVNQYGDVFTGPPDSGEDVANTVTNPAVRSALSTYLAWLGANIRPQSIWAVRQGGGPTGELRYPGGTYQGHDNSWWAYDASTQAALPASVSGWTPGTGTAAQARIFLDAYNRALNDFGVWMNDHLTAAFGVTKLVMLPGWGQRPGDDARVVGTRLMEHHDEFNQGLAWDDLLGRLPNPSTSIAYTTYLDAPSVASNPELEDPASYIAALAARDGYRLGGENTGNGSVAALQLSLQRARALGYVVVCWMSETNLVEPGPGQPTFAEFGSLGRSILQA